MTDHEILSAISSTEPSTFHEFLSGLPDTPVKGDRGGWRELFYQLKKLERAGYVEIERANQDGSIESLMLTGEGAEVVRRG